MAKGFLVGTLSTSNGWETTSPTEALAKHLTYWFQSRRNQGSILGEVPSFYFLVKQYGQDPDTLMEQARIELSGYIKELFPMSDVSVEKENKTEAGNNYRLIIAARVISDNQTYDLAQAVLVTGEEYKLLDQARLG